MASPGAQNTRARMCVRVFSGVSVVCFSIELFRRTWSEPTQSNRRGKNLNALRHRTCNAACVCSAKCWRRVYYRYAALSLPPTFPRCLHSSIITSEICAKLFVPHDYRLCHSPDSVTPIVAPSTSYMNQFACERNRIHVFASFFFKFFNDVLHQVIPLEFHAPKQRNCISNFKLCVRCSPSNIGWFAERKCSI